MPLKLITGGGGSVILDANTTATTYTMYVPAENGTLVTTASPVLGNASGLTTGTLPTARLPSIPKSNMPSGSILQVVNTLKSDTMASGTSETWLDVTGMSATITPTSSTSKIYVHVCVGRFYGTNSVVWRVLRNGGLYNAGDAASSRQQVHAAESNQGLDPNHTGQLLLTYIDSPTTTSSLTYQLQFRQEGTNFTFNRNGSDSDITNSYASRSSSSIILMEIAG